MSGPQERVSLDRWVGRLEAAGILSPILCPHCGLPWVGHICPDRNGWTREEKDQARAIMRRENPAIRFAPSTEEMARRFGHLARQKGAT